MCLFILMCVHKRILWWKRSSLFFSEGYLEAQNTLVRFLPVVKFKCHSVCTFECTVSQKMPTIPIPTIPIADCRASVGALDWRMLTNRVHHSVS